MANLDTKLPKLVTISTTNTIRLDGAYYKFNPESACPVERPLKVWVHGIPPIGQYVIDRLICYSGKFATDTDHFVGHADIFTKLSAVRTTHGGHREGAGRKPTIREPEKQLRAIWCWTTQSEQDLINAGLTATERTTILLEAVDAKDKGWDWWNLSDEQLKSAMEEIKNA